MIDARVWLSRFLILTIVFFGYPQKSAHAFAPALVPIGVALMESAGAVAVADASAGMVANLIGLTVGALGISFVSSAGDVPIRVPLVETAYGDQSMPAPDAPVTTAAVPLYGNGYTTMAAACANYAAVNGGVGPTTCNGNPGHIVYSFTSMPPGICYFNYTVIHEATGQVCSQSAGSANVGSYSACPTGYSGSPCTLTNARLAVSDGQADYQRAGTAISPRADADTTTLPVAVRTTAASNDTIAISGQDASGAPRLVSVQAQPAGGSTVTVQTQKADANGNSYVQNVALTINPAGTITAASQSTTAQTLQADPDTGLFTPVAAPTSTYAPAASSSNSPIEFPSDYARQGEAAAAAATVNATLGPKLDTLHQDLTDVGTAPADPQAEDRYQGFGSTFAGLLGWQVPGHTATCPSGSFEAFGHTFVLNQHCLLMAEHQGAITAAMTVAFTLLALLIILAA